MKIISLIVLISVLSASAVSAETEDAKIYLKGSRTTLKVEQNLFDDSYGGQVKTVPEKFRNKKINIIKTKARNGGDERVRDPIHVPVKFKVKKAGMVYIIADSRSSKVFTNDGWVFVDDGEFGCLSAGGEWDKRRAREYHILSKHYEIGEYTLPVSEGIGTRVIIM